jgi:hypothetical protein
MTPRLLWVPSHTAAGGEVYTDDGYAVATLQPYLDFLATQEVAQRRIHHIARVCIAAANWIAVEYPAGPTVLRETWEAYLVLAGNLEDLSDSRGLERVRRRVEILSGWSRFQHWYEPPELALSCVSTDDGCAPPMVNALVG